MAPRPHFRRLGFALFRLHVENGIAVAMGMLVVGAAFYVTTGLATMVLAYTGALCASIVDQPSRFSIKPPILTGAVAATSLVTFLASLTAASPLLFGTLVAAISFCAALISAYGRRALGLGISVVLALVLGMTGQKASMASALERTLIFAAGGFAYGAVALAMAILLDGRNRRVALGEALRAFAVYLRAKAAIFEANAADQTALRAVIEAHGVLTENLQVARDMIFARPDKPARARYVSILLTVLDAFEQILAASADIEILRRSQHHHLTRRMRALTTAFADDVDELVMALSGTRGIERPGHGDKLEAIAAEIARLERLPALDSDEEVARAAFEATRTKLARTAAQLEKLYGAIANPSAPPARSSTLDLASFMLQETTHPRVLLAQFTFASPILRYAVRLTLAMTAGCFITFLFPDFVHGGWILLTTALIMRANYSITRQRRNDRIVGTLLGCIVAAALIHVLPDPWPLAAIVLAVGVSHAYGGVNYRVTALAASVSALLLIHFMAPATQPLFFERMIDTLIGAALATLFSFVLPSWERRNVAQLVFSLVRASRGFAEQALLRAPQDQAYRLSRRAALDATAALTSVARRLLDEPGTEKRSVAALDQLLSANFLLASDLASVRTALKARAGEIDPSGADEALSAARGIVLDALTLDQAARAERPDRLGRRGLSELPAAKALPFLRRRLLHVERAARNVALLAQRAIAAQ
jgi:uncharacterized membrane protein YccC